MKSLYNEYLQTKKRNKILMFLSAAALAISAVVTVLNVLLAMKNEVYKNALIDLSEHFPDEDEAEDDETRWKNTHSNLKRTTTEERLENNRITVEA